MKGIFFLVLERGALYEGLIATYKSVIIANLLLNFFVVTFFIASFCDHKY